MNVANRDKEYVIILLSNNIIVIIFNAKSLVMVLKYLKRECFCIIHAEIIILYHQKTGRLDIVSQGEKNFKHNNNIVLCRYKLYFISHDGVLAETRSVQ